ncbi:MAG: PilC/PilY family type IV pilus protein [Pseudomonadota bacterium]|nr:PilC/PilY family type IV pilus protein [Pseudomonadota bacterium]
MANRTIKQIESLQGWRQRALVVACACLATLMGGPVNAAVTDVKIPAVPLQSGTPFPAPNILFILDDSGSMVFQTMPDDMYYSSFKNKTDIFARSYVHNTLYYNPNIDYKTWKKADGTRMTGGDSYGAAYPSLNYAWGDTIDLSDDDSCEKVDENGSDITICGGTQIFHVPRTGATDLSKTTSFDKYVINSSSQIYRIETGSTELLRKTDLDDTSGDRDTNRFTVTIPSGTDSFVAEVSGGSTGDADIRVYRKDWWGNWDLICNEGVTCEIDDPSAGDYRVVAYRDDDYKDVTLTVTALTTTTTRAVPTTKRDEAAELKNFAIWFSYHRTRMKVAKAGASEAFSALEDNFRIGFDTIHNRDRGVDSNGPDLTDGPAHPIPTGVEGGLFARKSDTSTGENRKVWFDFLHNARGNSGTPLHGALRRAGRYFESKAPWVSGEDSAISCRLSFAILTTDGYWNSTSGNDEVGNIDGKDGTKIDRPTGDAGLPYTYKAAAPFKDSHEDTLADVAMKYWNRDLRTDLANDVPTSGADNAFWQHMATFGVSIGLQGTIDPDTPIKDFEDGTVKWPDPTDKEDAERIDDLLHASINGHGKFVSATNPEKFVSGLLDALTTIAERPGSASNVTANSTSFTSDTRVYQASYTSGRWTGELTAYVATSAGVGTVAWTGSEGIPTDHTKRSIWTWSGVDSDGAKFPTPAQVTALDVSARAGSPADGDANAAYIAGDKSNEPSNDGDLRARTNVLGDIVNSSPIFVADSDALFVGANDGMLHAFDGSSGEELFAFVPGGISLTDLASLSDPSYGQTITHKYFVDGPITVSAKSQTPGKNYLVGALGRGGRGVFGLDVTTPSSFDDDDVLWQFSNDTDMGMVLGDPLVVTLNDSDKTKAVVVSNGINSPDGSATLFVLNIKTGEVIKEIDTGATGSNGLFAPRGWDDNGDGTVDTIYAGDLLGNLWKFDMSKTSKSDWKVANSGDPMYQARDAKNKAQPITAGLALARNPDNSDVWVFFGTGRFMTIEDLSTTEVQTLYGIKDDGIVKGRTSDTEFGDLSMRAIVAVSDDKRVRAFNEWQRSMEPDKKGWFLDLDQPYDGERVVSGLRVLGTTLIASSIVPGTGASSCDAGGTGYINAIDAFTGTSPSQTFFDINGDGVVNDKDKITATIDGETVEFPAGSIDLGIGMPTRATIIDKLLVVGGSSGGLGTVQTNPPATGTRRTSWREILRD